MPPPGGENKRLNDIFSLLPPALCCSVLEFRRLVPVASPIMRSLAFLPALACLATVSQAAPVPEATLHLRSWAFLNEFLAAVAEIFPVDETIQVVSSIITSGEQVLASFFDIQTTENSSRGCSDVTVLFARGTSEPGNVGALVGPPFFDSLTTMLDGSKSLSIQGVDYPASVEGYLNGDAGPGQTM